MAQSAPEQFAGSAVALVTPMAKNGDIDWSALDALVDFHLDAGTHGIVAVGTTGESPTVTMQENVALIERVVKRVNGRIPVIAGTGANATAEAIELTHGAHDVGADAALLVTPYYNKPTQEGLYQHYCAIAAAVPIPQILYNVPGRTACDLLPATVTRLAAVDNIIGIKESSGDVSRVTQIAKDCGSDFLIVSGEDAKTLEMMRLGAHGTISVTANVLPGMMSQFCGAYLAGDADRAAELDAQLQPMHDLMFVETSPAPAKWALHLMGRIDTGIRLPLVPLSEGQRAPLQALLKQMGAL